MLNILNILTVDKAIKILRWSLAAIFIWFGLLKVLGYNPVYEIVYGTYPALTTPFGNFALGLIEALIGFGLLVNVFPKVVHVVLILHLMGTMLTFVTSPSLMFDPAFPILSLSGEFVFKNVTLAASGLVMLAHQRRK